MSSQATGGCNRFVLPNAELPQVGDLGPRATPLLSVTTPEATADPLVQFAEAALDWHQAEVAYPALEIPAKLLLTVGERHAAIATRDGSHAVLELADILGADAKLAAVALEEEAEKLDSSRAADATLLAIDHQLLDAWKTVNRLDLTAVKKSLHAVNQDKMTIH